MRFVTCLAFAALAASTAFSGEVAAQLVGETFYSQTNLRIDRGNIHAVNYQAGTLLPAGTRVIALDRNDQVVSCQVVETGARFRFVNHRSSGKDVVGAFESFFGAAPPDLGGLTPEEATRVKGGQLVEGMSKEVVLLTLGPPPPHKTPSLEMDTWTYWLNRFKKLYVRFDGGRVTLQAAPEAAAPIRVAPDAEILYASCNVRYEDRETSWVNYRRGLTLPVNARVEIIKKGRNKVRFRALDTGLVMVFTNDERESGLSTWVAFQRYFSPTEHSAGFNALSGKERTAVKAGQVEAGMSKKAVEMSWCPAPPHGTPAFESSVWTYWTNRFNKVSVVFGGDEVTAVQQ